MLGLRTPIPFLAITILLGVPAEATTSYYAGASSEAAFNAAVGGLTLLDPSLTFSSSDLGSGGLFNASGTGINFLGFDDLNNPGINFTVNTGQLTATQGDQRVHITFPAANPIYAFGFHITLVSGSATFGSWCIGLTQGSCTYSVVNSTSSDVQFFGIVSDAPITAPLYIQGSFGSPKVVFTNLEAYSTPEARTMLLVGLGLISLRLARWKIRRRL